MKMQKIISTNSLAMLLNITTKKVKKLSKEGIFSEYSKNKYHLLNALIAYYKYLVSIGKNGNDVMKNIMLCYYIYLVKNQSKNFSEPMLRSISKYKSNLMLVTILQKEINYIINLININFSFEFEIFYSKIDEYC